MQVATASPPLLKMQRFFTHWTVGLFAAFMLVMSSMVAHAAPPPVGTSISNQASATYSDASGVSRTVTSNIVQTTVTQVASFTLTANGAQNAAAGGTVYYPHTLTNTGNGADSFALSTTNTGGFSMSSVQIFADNGSGQPTGVAITSTGSIAANGAFRFIVVATLPNTATAGQTNSITLTAASGFTPAVTAINTDTTTVTANAVITLTKAVSVASGAPGSGPFTYSITYSNTGNSNATSVAISDIIPAGLTYVAGSARWSVTGTTALSDTNLATGTAPNTLTSSYTAGTRTFLATLAQVTPGQSGVLSFNFSVASPLAPGVLNNTATSSYNNGAAVVTGSSNTVPFTVTQQASVTMTPPAAIATAAPGSTISFANLLTNTGNGTDTFNLAIGTSSFPVGTTFQIFKSDGATPLVDTNGDSVIDTGPVLAGGTYSVILKATLPLNASGGPFSVSKSATSVFNSAATATATDTLTAMTAATVDLRNTDTLGAGAGTETTIVTNVATAGGTTSFTLLAYNTGASADSYNLSAGSTAAMAALPAGWSVSFRAGSCPSTGATVTNTGSVAAAPAFGAVCAVVNVPAGAAAGTTDLYFRVLSPTSGATDYIRDAVTINVVRSLTIGNPGSGQVFPGGIVVYPHTLTNTGNAAENGSLSTISLTSSNSASSTGWTSSLYYDSNSNGVLDSGDPQITSSLSAAGYGGSLAPGASITIFDRVMAPSGAAVGASNSTTVTVSTLNGSYTSAVPATVTVADRTTVIAGNLTLTKAQAVNTACSNTPGSYTAANLSAAPNQCVDYRITVTNIGSADATTVVISDATPAFTTMSTAAVLTPAGTIVQPIVGSGGTVTATVGTLAPGASAVLTFSVRITP